MRDPYAYHRRKTHAIASIGGDNVPRVVVRLQGRLGLRMEDLAAVGHVYDPATDKWMMRDQAAEFLYLGEHPLSFMAPAGTRQILDYDTWLKHEDRFYCVPLMDVSTYVHGIAERHTVMNVIRCEIRDLTHNLIEILRTDVTAVLLLRSDSRSYYTSMRMACDTLVLSGLTTPVILERELSAPSPDDLVLRAATDLGGLFVDGFGDGTMLTVGTGAEPDEALSLRLAYNVLQAARTRMTKTEYISCPSCGRTLFDLQETTSLIRSHTDHLKGVKIGIMGCIVNGPGEMADADYGYVGSGPERITLYRGQDIVQRNIPAAGAVDALMDIIKNDGRWVERT
ncbi:MAG TPA: flavodoxin-dependent (E)-4-hydroxy-3-methylbut-2-enyl-diphosphate synthase [Candidatus Didemnitutus sp.]|nr:flavodoxin-dependent (E)-4-hydroxy-3-methylbut-2-enyl-diphosphate synthase [Candidatus Didemnitutus sp.]